MKWSRVEEGGMDWSATLINNIFANTFSANATSGNLVLRISDHLPQFLIVDNVKVNYKIGKRRKGDVIIAFADVSKIKQNIGWACKHSVEDALKSSWVWEKNLRDE